MEIIESVLSVGDGYYLGGHYKVEIVHVMKTRGYRYENKEEKGEWYEFRYKMLKQCGYYITNYPSMESLEKNIGYSFQTLNLRPTSSSRHHQVQTPMLSNLIDQRLLAFTIRSKTNIVFQCEFGTPPNEFHHWKSVVMPTAFTLQQPYTSKEAGYGNAIYELLGNRITYADEYVDAGIVFDFENGTSLQFGLKEPKYDSITYEGPNELSHEWYVMPDYDDLDSY